MGNNEGPNVNGPCHKACRVAVARSMSAHDRRRQQLRVARLRVEIAFTTPAWDRQGRGVPPVAGVEAKSFFSCWGKGKRSSSTSRAVVITDGGQPLEFTAGAIE